MTETENKVEITFEDFMALKEPESNEDKVFW